MPIAATAPSAGWRDTTQAVDHVGVVVHDLAAEVAAWRSLGFAVSDPVPLMGRDTNGQAVALGQSSAHVVFSNAYVELSAPVPGSGNHLEPYLAAGEGVRILVLTASDADLARAIVAARHPAVAPVAVAARDVVIDGTAYTARFRWFPLPFDVVPRVLSAVVQHLTPDLVFHPSFVHHPNGLTRIARVVARGRAADLRIPEGLSKGPAGAPRIAVEEQAGDLRIDRLGFDATGRAECFFRLGPQERSASS